MIINQKKQIGNTLVEVLIALVILAGGLFALMAFQADTLRDHKLINQENEALTLAQDRMQSFRSYSVIETSTDTQAYDDITDGSSTDTVNNTTYTTTWDVTDATNPIRKSITITTTWTDATSASHTVTIDSIIAKIEPRGTGKVSEGL